MPTVTNQVHFTHKEIQDMLKEKAKAISGNGAGGSTVRFEMMPPTDAQQKGPGQVEAVVTFQKSANP